MIFGEDIYAPCSGEIISVEKELPDNVPPKGDKENILGNHVTIFCDEHSILLAHLKRGITTVTLGERVSLGHLIGKVGNSGTTTEPHLHIHAAKGMIADKKEIAATAQGTPMIFDSHCPIRNDRIEN